MWRFDFSSFTCQALKLVNSDDMVTEISLLKQNL